MTNEHTSLEKYTSHTLFERFAKGLCVRGELETVQTATYWPQVPLTIAALLSHSAGLLNRGSWGPKPSAGSWFSLPRTATRTVCGTGLYNCLMYTCFPWASQLHWFNPSKLHLDIFDRMHLFLDWRLGRRSICYIFRRWHWVVLDSVVSPIPLKSSPLAWPGLFTASCLILSKELWETTSSDPYWLYYALSLDL